MEGPKYLIIITLIDGQNFNVPDGEPEKIEASVYAEARFGNESILTSDPIILNNSNPEFVTELAWQLDKKTLHQLRIERRAIKLQIFLQIREKTKCNRLQNNQPTANGVQSGDSTTPNKVELIGYTIIDIRSAQETDQPKFRWLPLLNPKFRKSSYNRPEIQLAVTLSRIEDSNHKESLLPSPSTVKRSELEENMNQTPEPQPEFCNGTDPISSPDNLMYRTCLDCTVNSDEVKKDEILENDITIRSKDGNIYVYDTSQASESTIDFCDEAYKITITIPFTSELEPLVTSSRDNENYYFSANLFGSSKRTKYFNELTSVDTKEIQFLVFTTHSSILTTYFELNSNLVIKLHHKSGESIGIASIKLDQLCSIDTKRRSIEGIFTLQSMSEKDIPSAIHPSIGVSVILEKLVQSEESIIEAIPQQDDHHFCFIIDLKSFSYTPEQRLIPTLRELLVRYSYPFFGYEDSFTTDASIPISSTKSIIVNGFFELNFATTGLSLLTAFEEIPLDLDILKCDEIKRGSNATRQSNNLVATSCLNLARTLSLDRTSILKLQDSPVSTTVSIPISDMGGKEIGEMQIYLCLKDLGEPKVNDIVTSNEHVDKQNHRAEEKPIVGTTSLDHEQLTKFMSTAKSDLDGWKEECLLQLSDELRTRENDRFRRMCQRFEAKEAKREQEFRKRMDELNNLETSFRNSLANVETLERKLLSSFEQLKSKDSSLDAWLNTFDLKISQAIGSIKEEYEKKLDSVLVKFQTSNATAPTELKPASNKLALRGSSEIVQARRLSLRHPNAAGIPVPVRSSSLVRGPSEGASTRIVKRATGIATTVINGVTSRPRSNSTRLNLSKETQEKLISLRKEKAELLKRGCRPNDELILEINSLIEKITC